MSGQTGWRSIGRGVVAGAIAAVLLSGLLALLGALVDGFSGSGAERAASLLVIPCYSLAGFFAVGSLTASPARDGALAGMGVALVGTLVTVVLLAISGGDVPKHANVAFIGPYVFGAAFGALGGRLRARGRTVRSTSAPFEEFG